MLKIGTQTGSVVNHIYSRSTLNQPKVEVGMGATFLSWTDRNAGTIIEVIGDGISAGTIIVVQQDQAIRTDKNGYSEDQTYEYSRDPNGYTQTFRLNKKGFWEGITKNSETGRWNKCSNGGVRIGTRESYRDPCF